MWSSGGAPFVLIVGMWSLGLARGFPRRGLATAAASSSIDVAIVGSGERWAKLVSYL